MEIRASPVEPLALQAGMPAVRHVSKAGGNAMPRFYFDVREGTRFTPDTRPRIRQLGHR
jgi:hypothetical protein